MQTEIITDGVQVDKHIDKRTIKKPRTLARERWLRAYYAQDSTLAWARQAFRNSRRRAREHGIAHDLTVDQIVAMLPESMLCPILGLPMQFGLGMGHRRDYNATIDRKRPYGAYTASNCHVICDLANRSKASLNLTQMMLMGAWAAGQFIKNRET